MPLGSSKQVVHDFEIFPFRSVHRTIFIARYRCRCRRPR